MQVNANMQPEGNVKSERRGGVRVHVINALPGLATCHRPEAGKRDDGFIEPPRGDKVVPDRVGGVISPGRLETNNGQRLASRQRNVSGRSA